MLRMPRISITTEAYEAIKATWPPDAYADARENGNDGFFITISDDSLNKLDQMRGLNESYSGLILRIADSD